MILVTDKTGLIYFGFRYYDSELGRWLKFDPAKEDGNFYVFVANNPISAVDILGLVQNYLNKQHENYLWKQFINNKPSGYEVITQSKLIRYSAQAYKIDNLDTHSKGYFEYIKAFRGKSIYNSLDTDLFLQDEKTFEYFEPAVIVNQKYGVIDQQGGNFLATGGELNYHLMGATTKAGKIDAFTGMIGVFMHKADTYEELPSGKTLSFYSKGRRDSQYVIDLSHCY